MPRRTARIFCAWGSVTSTSGRHMPGETDVREARGHLGPLMQIKEEKWRTTEMNKPLKWLQGWTAERARLWSASLRYARDDGPADCTKRRERGCRNCPGLLNRMYVWLHYNMGLKFDFIAKVKLLFSFTEDCSDLRRPCFKCRRVTWRAACVDSLFPRLLCCSLCSDMFLSPSSKFPSFRERSEARDCDLPWGWVKDSPPPPPSLPPLPSLRDGLLLLHISLFCIHLSPLFSLGSTDRVQKEPPYRVSSSILDCSDRSISAPPPVVWSHCARKKKKKKRRGKKRGNFTDHAVENNQFTNPMDIMAPV